MIAYRPVLGHPQLVTFFRLAVIELIHQFADDKNPQPATLADFDITLQIRIFDIPGIEILTLVDETDGYARFFHDHPYGDKARLIMIPVGMADDIRARLIDGKLEGIDHLVADTIFPADAGHEVAQLAQVFDVSRNLELLFYNTFKQTGIPLD